MLEALESLHAKSLADHPHASGAVGIVEAWLLSAVAITYCSAYTQHLSYITGGLGKQE